MGSHGDTLTVSKGVRGDAEKPGVAREPPPRLCMLGMCLRVKEPGAGHTSCWEGWCSGGWLNRHSPEPKGEDSCSGYIPKERVHAPPQSSRPKCSSEPPSRCQDATQADVVTNRPAREAKKLFKDVPGPPKHWQHRLFALGENGGFGIFFFTCGEGF